jgi:hypothetical protein
MEMTYISLSQCIYKKTLEVLDEHLSFMVLVVVRHQPGCVVSIIEHEKHICLQYLTEGQLL